MQEIWPCGSAEGRKMLSPPPTCKEKEVLWN